MDNGQGNNNANYLSLTVPNNIADDVFLSLYSVSEYSLPTIEKTQAEENNTTITIKLSDEYQEISLEDYISKVTNYNNISLEAFEFLSQYGVNKEIIKNNIKFVTDAELFDKMLQHIDKPDAFKDTNYIQVINPYKESVEKLLKYGFQNKELFLWLINMRHTDKNLQIDNIKTVTSSLNFNWDNMTLSHAELDLIKALYNDYQISTKVAFDSIMFHMMNHRSTIDKKTKDEKDEYEELLISICQKAQKNKEPLQESYVHTEGLSLRALQALLDCGIADYHIIPEVFRKIQASQGNLNSEQIDFLTKNKDAAINYLAYNYSAKQYLTLDLYLNLYDQGVITKYELIDQTINYLEPGWSYPNGKAEQVYNDWDKNAIEKIMAIVGHDTFRDALLEPYTCITISRHDDTISKSLFSLELTEYFYEKKLIDANILLLYGAYQDNLNVIERALSDGGDFSHQFTGTNSVFSNIMEYASHTTIHQILDKNPQINVRPEELVYLIDRFSFIEKKDIFKKLYSEGIIEHTATYLRGAGLSRTEIKFVEELFQFLIKFDEISENLSESEKLILSNKQDLRLNDLNQHEEFTNPAGFTLLQLALIGDKFDLMLDIINNSPELINTSSVTGINIFCILKMYVQDSFSLSAEESKKMIEVKNSILDHLQNVDDDLGRGETIADLLQSLDGGMEKILQRSKDPLFHFFKVDESDDIIEAFPQDGKIHIAVAHCYENLWSTGALSVSRLASQKHKDIQFHLITPDHMSRGGDELLKLFDGFLLPGGTDNYPKIPEFTYKNFAEHNKLPINEQYFKIMEISDELGIPLIGMCAGAQNLILKEKGTLAPVKGYGYGQHDIEFTPGTLPYFMSLDKDFQEHVIDKIPVIQLPIVSYKGDTAHNYAGVKGKLGENVKLAAVSEDGVVMSCRAGLKIVTQYHPEHYYGMHDPNADSTFQTNFIDSFIRLAQMYNHTKENLEGVIAPKDYIESALNAMAAYIPTEDCNPDAMQALGDQIHDLSLGE